MAPEKDSSTFEPELRALGSCISAFWAPFGVKCDVVMEEETRQQEEKNARRKSTPVCYFFNFRGTVNDIPIERLRKSIDPETSTLLYIRRLSKVWEPQYCSDMGSDRKIVFRMIRRGSQHAIGGRRTLQYDDPSLLDVFKQITEDEKKSPVKLNATIGETEIVDGTRQKANPGTGEPRRSILKSLTTQNLKKFKEQSDESRRTSERSTKQSGEQIGQSDENTGPSTKPHGGIAGLGSMLGGGGANAFLKMMKGSGGPEGPVDGDEEKEAIPNPFRKSGNKWLNAVRKVQLVSKVTLKDHEKMGPLDEDVAQIIQEKVPTAEKKAAVKRGELTIETDHALQRRSSLGMLSPSKDQEVVPLTLEELEKLNCDLIVYDTMKNRENIINTLQEPVKDEGKKKRKAKEKDVLGSQILTKATYLAIMNKLLSKNRQERTGKIPESRLLILEKFWWQISPDGHKEWVTPQAFLQMYRMRMSKKTAGANVKVSRRRSSLLATCEGAAVANNRKNSPLKFLPLKKEREQVDGQHVIESEFGRKENLWKEYIMKLVQTQSQQNHTVNLFKLMLEDKRKFEEEKAADPNSVKLDPLIHDSEESVTEESSTETSSEGESLPDVLDEIRNAQHARGAGIGDEGGQIGLLGRNRRCSFAPPGMESLAEFVKPPSSSNLTSESSSEKEATEESEESNAKSKKSDSRESKSSRHSSAPGFDESSSDATYSQRRKSELELAEKKAQQLHFEIMHGKSIQDGISDLDGFGARFKKLNRSDSLFTQQTFENTSMEEPELCLDDKMTIEGVKIGLQKQDAALYVEEFIKFSGYSVTDDVEMDIIQMNEDQFRKCCTSILGARDAFDIPQRRMDEYWNIVKRFGNKDEKIGIMSFLQFCKQTALITKGTRVL